MSYLQTLYHPRSKLHGAAMGIDNGSCRAIIADKGAVMFLDAMTVQGACTAKCADRNAVQDLALSRTLYSFTPLLITAVARRSPKGMEYNTGTGDGDRR